MYSRLKACYVHYTDILISTFLQEFDRLFSGQMVVLFEQFLSHVCNLHAKICRVHGNFIVLSVRLSVSNMLLVCQMAKYVFESADIYV